jgi:methylated-DNA-[protein]-cysteine S-methyltransferase
MGSVIYRGECLQKMKEPGAFPFHHRRNSPGVRGVIFDTAQGYVGLVLDEKDRLAEATMPRETVEDAAEALGLSNVQPFSGEEPAQDLIDQIRAYLAGERTQFTWPINLSGLTAFQQEALTICASIPYGELRSYGWIADCMGRHKSARPVGQAMSVNPIPIVIPCHRVVGSNGKRAGYGGGMYWKERLLKLEGIAL